MKSLVLLLAIVLVAGCGDGKFSSPSGSITSTQAASFATNTSNGGPQDVIKFNTASAPSDLPTQGLSRDEEESDCETIEPESPVDADSDGAYLTKKVTWNCTDVEQRDGRYTRQGSMTITDKDDTVAYGGYKYEYDVTGNGTHAGSTYNYEYKGFWEMTKTARNGAEPAARAGESTRATSWTFNTDWEGTYNYQASGHAASSGSWGHTFEFTMSENAAARDAIETRVESGNGEGTAAFKGFYAYAGTGDHRDGGINVVFRVESSGLTWKRSGCSNFYNGGSIKWTDGAGNVMIWEYSSCTTWRVTYNGSTVYEDNTP